MQCIILLLDFNKSIIYAINNKRANWPLTMLYKNIKSTIKHRMISLFRLKHTLRYCVMWSYIGRT